MAVDWPKVSVIVRSKWETSFTLRKSSFNAKMQSISNKNGRSMWMSLGGAIIYSLQSLLLVCFFWGGAASSSHLLLSSLLTLKGSGLVNQCSLKRPNENALGCSFSWWTWNPSNPGALSYVSWSTVFFNTLMWNRFYLNCRSEVMRQKLKCQWNSQTVIRTKNDGCERMSISACLPLLQISGVTPVTLVEWKRNLTQFDHQSLALSLPLSLLCTPLPLSTSVFLVMSNQINWGERCDKEGAPWGAMSLLPSPPSPHPPPHHPCTPIRPPLPPARRPPALSLLPVAMAVLVCIELSYLLHCTLTPPNTHKHNQTNTRAEPPNHLHNSSP